MSKKRSQEPEEESSVFKSIEEIPGIGPATAQKLKEIGYNTVESLATATVNELMSAGISDKVAVKIIAHARSKINVEFVSALDILENRKNIRKLTTGSKNIDSLLAGGLETMTITEFFGEYGTGKSQMCHQLCVNVQLPFEQGGLDGSALYIDTENTFRPERISAMAKHLNLDLDEVLKKIVVAEAYNSDHQILILERSDKIIKENNVKLLVVDSVTSHFRSEYLGREHLVMRQQKLNSHLHKLERLAVAFNLVAVVTNQVMARPNEFFGLGAYPVGGHIIGHRSHNRIFIRKAPGKRGLRIARLVVSLDRPEGEALFEISENGITDPEGKGESKE